jgi:hypothetical protein
MEREKERITINTTPQTSLNPHTENSNPIHSPKPKHHSHFLIPTTPKKKKIYQTSPNLAQRIFLNKTKQIIQTNK